MLGVQISHVSPTMEDKDIALTNAGNFTWKIVVGIAAPNIHLVLGEELFGTSVDQQVPNIQMERIVDIDKSQCRIELTRDR